MAERPYEKWFVCPVCHGDLAPDASANALECRSCAVTYKREETGAYNFLPPEIKLDSEESASQGINLLKRGRGNPLVRFAMKYVPRPDLVLVLKRDAQRVDQFIESVASKGGYILNIGSGDHDYGPNVVNLDIFAGKNIGVLGVGNRLPFRDGCFDAVMSLAVLEHVPAIESVLSELHRVTRTNGRCFHAVPFLQPFHAVPEDYRRYTLPGLEALFGGFEKEISGVGAGPGSAIAWMLREYFSILTSFGSIYLYNAGMLVWGWIFWPVKFTDVFLAGHRFAPQIASGFYFQGRKTGPRVPA